MSFVRFTESGSDVYIYEDYRGYVTCCGCAFTFPTGDDFRTTVLDDMLGHLERHRAEGHHVPAWVDDELRSRWPDFDKAGGAPREEP